MKKYIDRKLFLILLGYVGAYHVIYISRRVILKLIKENIYNDTGWLTIIFEPLLSNLIIIPPIILLILLVTKKMIINNYKWRYIILIHFVFSLIYVFLIYLSGNLYNFLIYGGQLEVFSKRILYGANLNFLGYVGFVSIIYSYYYINKTTQIGLQKAQLSEQLINVKMEVLKSQLNPHFLFNTLNSISSLIKEDTHKAQHMIGNLGDLLRDILLLKNENRIPLYKEIIILNKYIEIMKIRFSDHLSIKINIEEHVNNALIPTMLIQPIIENSFKHGYSYNFTELEVKLDIYEKDKKLVIQIENNGTLIKEKNDNGFKK